MTIQNIGILNGEVNKSDNKERSITFDSNFPPSTLLEFMKIDQVSFKNEFKKNVKLS